jgi:hypothetical protein
LLRPVLPAFVLRVKFWLPWDIAFCASRCPPLSSDRAVAQHQGRQTARAASAAGTARRSLRGEIVPQCGRLPGERVSRLRRFAAPLSSWLNRSIRVAFASARSGHPPMSQQPLISGTNKPPQYSLE